VATARGLRERLDCLETLEEIGMRARDSVKAAGGELILVPSLNATPRWLEAVVDLARAAAPAVR
jgi:ferrochelatase